MPKLKSHKGAVKRFRKTGRGKVRRRQALMRHLLTGKRRKRKRALRRSVLVKPVDVGHIKELLPYLSKM